VENSCEFSIEPLGFIKYRETTWGLSSGAELQRVSTKAEFAFWICVVTFISTHHLIISLPR
jgi:hypothetical protein